MRGTASDSVPEDSAAAALDVVVRYRSAKGAGIETSKAAAMLKQRARFIARFPTWTELSQTSRCQTLDGQRRRTARLTAGRLITVGETLRPRNRRPAGISC